MEDSKRIAQQANLIIVYTNAIKEICNALKSIQNHSLKQINEILVSNTDDKNYKEIKNKVERIDSFLGDIQKLFKSKNIDELKNAINDFSYQVSLYEYYESGEYEYESFQDDLLNEYEKSQEKQAKEYEEYEKKLWNEHSENEKLYGQDYANKYLNYKMHTPATIASLKNLANIHPSLMDNLNENIKSKNYTKYSIEGVNSSFVLHKMSKRMVPTKVFEYLFANGFLTDKDLIRYSTNQFGRTFETKRGDIQTEEDMKDNKKNLHRYNKIDFSKIKNSKYHNTLYISNQWDYDSLTEFIKHINEIYKGIIFVTEENKNKKELL